MKKIKVMACVSLIFSSWLFKNVDTYSMPNKKVTAVSSQTTIVKQSSMAGASSTETLTTEFSNISLTTSSTLITSRKYANARDIVPGEAIYKPTFLNGVEVEEGGRRPHLVIDKRVDSFGRIILTVADMSRVRGREGKVSLKNGNYLINPEDPNFTGKNITFVKLNRTVELDLKPGKRQVLLGRTVNDFDLFLIRKILGFD